MAIQGPLRELGIHDVFQLLDLSWKTGVLTVTSELRQNEGVIWFETGAVVAASVRSNPHRIGDLLIRSGKIREEDLVQVKAMQDQGDGRRMGELLVEVGALSARELERQVRQQVEEVVFSVLGWSEGYFVFEEEVSEEIPRDAHVRITTEALLMEAARRIDEWERIQPRIPHLGVVPHLAPADGNGGGGGAAPGGLSLTPFEWRVLTACDGALDVRAIARSLPASEFDVARTLFGLDSAGVIVLHDPAAAQPRTGPRVEPAELLRQGEEHLRRGDAAAARAVAESLVAAAPGLVAGSVLVGRSRMAAGEWVEAEAACRDVLRMAPGHATGLRLLGMARAAQGRFVEALQAWDAWLELADRPADEDRALAEVTELAEAARTLNRVIVDGGGGRGRGGR